MSKDFFTLRTYPYNLVCISWAKCDRAGQWWRQNLIDRDVPDIAMPDPRQLLALAQCPRRKTWHAPCMVIYFDFAAGQGR
jgi:hypothetical protein